MKTSVSRLEFNEQLKSYGFKNESQLEAAIDDLSRIVQRGLRKQLGLVEEPEEKVVCIFVLVDRPVRLILFVGVAKLPSSRRA